MAHTPFLQASTRTYDSKLVSREMHRLGNLAHSHLTTLTPTLSATSQNSTLHAHANAGIANTSATSTNEPWQALHVHVLPLFNGEQLRVPM